MTIEVTQLPDAKPRPRRVAIGTFDGVHVGHRKVIEGADTVLTFEPHPVKVIHPEAAPKLIMPFSAKRDVIDGLGVYELVVIPFDREFSKRTAEEFIERHPDRAARRHARLGRRELPLRRQGRRRPPDARRARRVRDPDRAAGRGRRRDVSSTRIRALVLGRRRRDARCAASARRSSTRARWSRATSAGASSASRPPTSSPTTTSSTRATASTRASPTAIRRRSTSACGRCSRPAAALLIEPHLIDYEGDLYGKTLRVAFIARLRGEKRFPSVEELIAQMQQDVEEARELCASFRGPKTSAPC